MKPITTMGIAFAAAGFKPTGDRLMDIAIEAWTKWSTLSGAAARTKHVEDALRGDLTWALISQYGGPRDISSAISRLLNDAKEMIAARQPRKDASKDAGGGHSPIELQDSDAPAQPSNSGGHIAHEPQRRAAAGTERKGDQGATATQSTTVSLAALADKHAAASQSRIHVEMRLADKLLINGKPLRRCIVSEVRAWAGERERDAGFAWRDFIFARNLTANLPGNEVIGERWRDEEIEEFYDRAGHS